jgi:hypothetical protein
MIPLKLQILLLLHMFLLQILPSEGRTKRRRLHEVRPGRHDDVDRFDEVYTIVRNTFMVALTPVILSFLYSVYWDPELPRLRRAVCYGLKRRLLGNLSSKSGRVVKISREDSTEG